MDKRVVLQEVVSMEIIWGNMPEGIVKNKNF